MTTRKGTITVQTSDIFPIIKKWLYSEDDIFLRELVSNSCDAISKRQNLGRAKNQELPNGEIKVEVDSTNNIITIQDNGIGMTEEEVEKYIAQLAFSGAQEFVEKLKEEGASEDAKDEIIGKFGLGFYSAFMVAKKVEIDSLSMTKDVKATKWICSGDTDYEFAEGSRDQVGTTVTIHLNDDSHNFNQFFKIKEVLSNYCRYMPFPITLLDIEKEKEENIRVSQANVKIVEDNKAITEEDKKKPLETISDYLYFQKINDTEPLWKKDPNTLKDEDYLSFYKELFPMDPEPLFWLHLKVDHPFELKGILYFPKFNPTKPVNENSIKLFCKQVFVSDNIKSIIPEFLNLLKGAIDSPDIPLNVSRSALQGDPNVKKISNYIVKKVSESLKKLFRKDREKYEKIWEDIGLFVKFGSVSDNKFDELMREMVLFKNSDKKLVTFQEYEEAIPSIYLEKIKGKMIYSEMEKSDISLRKQLQNEGVQTIDIDDHIDPHYMQHVEMHKLNDREVKFVSADSEIENILESAEAGEGNDKIMDLFKSILAPEKEKKDDNKDTPMPGMDGSLCVEVKGLKNSTSVGYIKVDEQMKRFQQMTQRMGQTTFSMPLKKTLVINPTNKLVQNTLKISEKGDNQKLVEKMCHHVEDLANISSVGISGEDASKFVERSEELIKELSTLAL